MKFASISLSAVAILAEASNAELARKGLRRALSELEPSTEPYSSMSMNVANMDVGVHWHLGEEHHTSSKAGKSTKGAKQQPLVPTSPFSSNICRGSSGKVLPAVGLTGSMTCADVEASSGTNDPKPQTGGDVSCHAKGLLEVGDRPPILVPLATTDLCVANTHWHIGAEHKSDGEYDLPFTPDNGPEFPPQKENYTGKRCGFYKNRKENDLTDRDFEDYKFQHCVGATVGETYEIHWPMSTLAACGQYNNQYQTPFVDGLLCKGPTTPPAIPLPDGFFAANLAVQAQVFTVVNNDDHYYPNLLNGMLVDESRGIGRHITAYTGSRTGDGFDDQPDEPRCDDVSPVTWQVDRKCHLLSASALDKYCQDIKTMPGMLQCGAACDGMPEYATFVLNEPADVENDGKTCCFPDTKVGRSRGVNNPRLVADNQKDINHNCPPPPAP